MKEAGKNSFFTVVGIIQSLAFVQLMEISLVNITLVTIGNSIEWHFNQDNWILIMHSIIGFLIIIRLFTTMLFAVEDYKHFVLGIYELFLIFLIGALEFYLFDALQLDEITGEFNAKVFYFRFMIIAIFTLIGYSIALIKVMSQGSEKAVKNYKIERNLQLFNNVGGVILLLIMQMVVVFGNVSSQNLLNISIASTGIIFMNILFSYKYSMLPKKRKINQAKRADIPAIVKLLIKEIDYIYEVIFPDTSEVNREKLLKRILNVPDKNNFLYYKRFYCIKEKVVVEKDNGQKETVEQLLGITGLITTEKVSAFAETIFKIKVFLVLLYSLSFSQFRNFLKSIRENSDLFTSDVKDSGYITYLIVKDGKQRRGIGSKLLKFSVKYFKKRKYEKVSLVVRSENDKALSFFNKHGFKEEKIKADRFVEKGKKVIMVKKI